MSDDLVKRARAALDEVTDGPWEVAFDDSNMVLRMKGDAQMGDPSAEISSYYLWVPENKKDWHFIAASRDLVPEMADRIEALTAERDALAEKLEKAVEALTPFSEAAHRIDHYDSEAYDAPLYASKRGEESLRELLDGVDGKPVMVAHLRHARATLAHITGDKTDD